MKKILGFLLIWAFLSGCKKDKGSTLYQSYVFVNDTYTSITMDIYKTRGDYNKNQKPFRRLVIDEVATTELEPGKTYYIDWYSEDFSISNWQNSKTSGEVSPTTKWQPEEGDSLFHISAPENGLGASANRKLLIDDNKEEQHWKAVAFYKEFGTVNTWQELLPFQQTLELITRKNFDVVCNYKDSSNKAATAKSTMKVSYNNFKISISGDVPVAGEIRTDNGGMAVTTLTSLDTLSFEMREPGKLSGKYILVRAQ